jgi:hypothetical protein
MISYAYSTGRRCHRAGPVLPFQTFLHFADCVLKSIRTILSELSRLFSGLTGAEKAKITYTSYK